MLTVLTFAGLFFGLMGASSGYIYEEELLYDHFPDGFLWGAATAAYQVSFIRSKLVPEGYKRSGIDGKTLHDPYWKQTKIGRELDHQYQSRY